MSQISPLFLSSEKELFSWTYLLKKTTRRTKILISPVWNKIFKIWEILYELIQLDVQCSKNYFNFFLPQEAGAFGNSRNGTVKAMPKIEKICILYICREHLLCLQSNAIGSFLQKYFVEQRIKFSQFEGSIIPQDEIKSIFHHF